MSGLARACLVASSCWKPANDVGKIVLKAGLEAQGDKQHLVELLPDVRLTMTNAPLQTMFDTCQTVPLLADLRVDVLKAGATQDFLIGDDPALLTNRWFVGPDGIPNCGFAMRGLIVTLPLAPTHTIMLSDASVYRNIPMGSLAHRQTLALNLMQARHAVSNVYFKDPARVSESLSQLASMEKFARAIPSTVTPFAHNGRKGIAIGHVRAAMRLPPEIDLLEIRFSAKRKRSRFDPVRDRKMVALVQAMRPRPDQDRPSASNR